MVMVLFLDSLGQCVSALSKRFAAAESIRDSTVNCLPHSHREKHSEVRHRKDTHHPQEDTPKPKVALTNTCRRLLQYYCRSSLFAKDAYLPTAVTFWNLSWAVSNADNQRQSTHLHSKEAKSHLRVGPRTQPQTERRTEGSIQGAGDHGTWWGKQ